MAAMTITERARLGNTTHQVRVGSHSPLRMFVASCSSRGSLAIEASGRTAWARRAAGPRAGGRAIAKGWGLQARWAARRDMVPSEPLDSRCSGCKHAKRCLVTGTSEDQRLWDVGSGF